MVVSWNADGSNLWDTDTGGDGTGPFQLKAQDVSFSTSYLKFCSFG